MEEHEQKLFSRREINSASSDGATTAAATGKGTKRPREKSPQNDGSGPPVRIKLEPGLESHPQENAQRNSTPAPERANNSSTPSPSTSKTTPNRPAPISNFFQFSSAPLPNFVPTLVDIKEREQGLGAPPPIMPKVAHYNAHDEKDEVRYVEEHEAQANRIIQGHKLEGSDSEEEKNTNGYYAPENASRYFQNEATVFSRYDFVNRKIDTSRLAVASAKEKILNAIENHRVVIVDGFTGCGKTTQVPQFILDQYYQNKKIPNIVVTQPRKIAAISVAKRVCAERGWTLGKVVGYQVGMESKKDKNDTLITYMTTGVLLQKLIGCRKFNHLTHIIIDEVHERDLESDLLLLVIKKILQDDIEGKQRHVKFVLMSATLNAKKFSKYFPTQTGESDVSECPVVKIPHTFRHRVDELFLENILQNNKEMYDVIENCLNIDKASIPEEVYTVAVDCIVGLDEIDRKMSTDPRVRSAKANSAIQKRGSVLVFLPGMEEINRLFRSLNAKNKIALDEACQNDPNFKESDFYKWDVVPLHSTITNDEQQRVFQSQIDYHRKIILSTNIAESSVTVPDVMYVIDFCLTKSLCIDPFTNFTTLRMVWASVSQCIQRKGRTGRVCDGKVYRLIPKSFFSQLPQDTKPEMLRANLETVVLQLKKLNMGDPKELLAMALDPPVISGIERAVANLKELGALTICRTRNGRPQYDTCDGDLTFLGAVMTDLPIPQQCTRLIMLGHCFGVMKESIIIAAALSVKNPFSTPFVRSLEAYLSRLNWAKKSCSDLFALYYVYKHWLKQFAESGDFQGSRSQYNERQWARGAFVQLSVLREIKSTVELIEDRLVRHSLIPNPLSADTSPSNDLPKEASLMLKLAIAGAFYPNFFHRRRPDVKTYERDKSREICGLDLFNTVYFKGFPPGHNGKVYAKPVSDHLSFGLNVPSIKFDGQKVLATFDNRGEKIGPISKGVYRAVKQRQLRDILEFPLATRDVERKVIENWDKKIEKRRFTRCPNQIELPGVDTPRIYVRVTHVENPGQFWINYSSQTKHLDEMVSRINDELVHISMPSARIVPNALCLAPYQDTYYRAKILLVIPRPIDDSLVYFVDYGNTCWVKNSVLEDFSPSMIEKGYHLVPCMGVECRLSNIKPATIHGAGWHEKSKLEFEIFAENAPFVCMDVYSVTKSIIAGKLVGHDERRVEQSLNEKLVCLGFAERCDEATYSEFNHRARTRVHLQDAEEKKAHNKEQIGEQLDYDFVITDFSRDHCVKQTLKGPWSPLELDFQSLCHSSNTKQVKVDTNSVNSVVLDTEPTAPISRLMVSAYVGIQDRSGSVVARDTTIMPSVPGLLPLLSMLFAPKIELRVDIRQTRYTGVLCGLGTAPGEPDLPIYPDHDVEIVFDTHFDDEDIDSINKIRFMMNLILRKGSSVNIAHYQNSVHKELVRLLQRQRKGADEEVWPQEEYVWNRIDEASIKFPNKGSFIYEAKDIFCPHNKVLLNLDNDGNWAWEFAV